MDAPAAVNRLFNRYHGLAVMLGLATDLWGVRRSRADEPIISNWMTAFSALRLTGNTTLSGLAIAQTVTPSPLAAVLTPSATVNAAFPPPTAYVHRPAVPMSPVLAAWTAPPVVLGFLCLLVLCMVTPTLVMFAGRASQSAQALGHNGHSLLQQVLVSLIVSMRFALSLVGSAFSALYRLVSLVVTACASFVVTVVAIGSLVKSYVCAVHRRLIWIFRNGSRIVVTAHRFARFTAWLHTVSARFVMRIVRAVADFVVSCISHLLSVVVPVVRTVARVTLALVNFVPTCVWNLVIPSKVCAGARRIAAAVDMTRRCILFVISVYQSLACRVNKAATVVLAFTDATIFAVSHYTASCVYIAQSVFVVLKGLVAVSRAVLRVSPSAWQRVCTTTLSVWQCVRALRPSAAFPPAC